jgi:uncharacterized BrkB/YihY/UPF0761 family membrane protein
MKANILSLAPLAMALTAALGSQPVAAQQTTDFNQSELIRSLLPSAVNILSTVATTALGSAGSVAASSSQTVSGSGVVIDPSGLIATKTTSFPVPTSSR